jgi:esterase/lipase superfamily enzyme
VLSEAELLGKVCPASADTSHDILLFVHCYNTTFEFACLRTAQIAYDVRFSGSPVLFSWPSQGTLSGYVDDEAAAARSAAPLGQLLLDLNSCASKGNKGHVHIIAHSMGNRVMLAAMSFLAQKIAPDDNRIGHVIMAAPDVDTETFQASFPAVRKLASTVTLYFCDQDLALQASAMLHKDVRIGQQPLILDGLTDIDASRANTSLMGHGYFASQSLLLIDMQEVLAGLTPENRPTICRAISPGPLANMYWMFP